MAITNYITSRTELKAYCLRRLGQPVVRVEVDDTQLEDCINIAVDKFVEYADDGSSMRFGTFGVTAGTHTFTLPKNVYSIRNLYDTQENVGNLSAVFPGRLIADTYGAKLTAADGLLSLEVTRSKLAELSYTLTVQPIYDFNTTTNTLHLLEAPVSNATYGMIYYEKLDYSDTTSSVYDHSWIKRYSTELAREQWGVNLTKYEGSMLPSGLTMNPSAMVQKAEQEREKLEQELQDQWALPIDMFIG